MAKNLQRAITQKKYNNFFSKFLPDYLLIILYYLTKFKAHSCYSFRDILITNIIMTKGHNSTKGDNTDLKNTCHFFLMWIPYMKFLNCILINFVTDARTDRHTQGRTDKPKAIRPFNFSKVGGIKIGKIYKISKQLALFNRCCLHCNDVISGNLTFFAPVQKIKISLTKF